MAASVVGTDIDSFIKEQKAKLASERNALNEEENHQPTRVVPRSKWDRQAGPDIPLAREEPRPRTQEGGLPLTNNKSAARQRELAEERNHEYNQLLRKNKVSRGVSREGDEEISNPSIIPFNRADEDRERRRRMEGERQREYQQMKAKLEENHKRGRREASERALQSVNGVHPERRVGDRSSILEQTDEYKANQPGMNDSDLAKIEKERQRNEEYNQFLRENNMGRRTITSDREVDRENYATLPGLRDSHSAKVRKEQQRNREYNEFLASRSSQRSNGKPPPAPRRGWATPTYEDILDRKREQEAQYRRANDPAYGQPAELDGRVKHNNRESDTKEWSKSNNETQALMQEYREVLSRLQDFNHNVQRRDREPVEPPQNVSPPQTRQAPWTREACQENPSDCYATLPIDSEGGTSRAVPSQSGPYSTEEAKRRQKQQYRDELQKQIREAAEGRRREKEAERNISYTGEKQMDIKVDYSGLQDPEERKAPVPALPLSSASSRRPPPAVGPAHRAEGLDRLDQLNSRLEMTRGRSRLEEVDRNPAVEGNTNSRLLDNRFSLSRGVEQGTAGLGLLDSGFHGLLEAPRLSGLAPPPGLQYQPASYITQGGGGLGQTSVDDAYNFYASRSPLDVDLPVTKTGGDSIVRTVQTSQDRAYTGRGDGEVRGGGGAGALSDRGGGGRTGRVRFEDEEPRRLAATMEFPNNDDNKRQAQKKAQVYHEELSRQVEEKKRKKMLEQKERERYDQKLEEEARAYNPYGRGGGGAPMRDAQGNVVTDLRLMHRDADNPDSSRRALAARSEYNPPAPSAAVVARDDLFGPPPVQTTAEGEQSHARGGHGIFGMPKTSEEKVASEKYKEELRRQIEEQKMEKMRMKELERQEEEREQQRLEEQRRRMQLEYEEEQRKLKEKEEEARKKNEELVQQAEERKREAERRRKEAEEKKLEEERQQREEINARLANVERGKSPVIPTLRNKVPENEGDAYRGKSPAIPALRNKPHENERESPPVPAARTRAADEDPVPSTCKRDSAPGSRAASADVLNQLAVMRRQLQSERQRVEDMLQTEKKEPDVFDPRLMERPPASKPDVDVFETARHGNAVAVRRTPADRGNPQTIEDFSALKHKDDSDSRKEFRKLFPEQPVSGDALEAQQAAFLRQQEESLHALREQRERDQTGYLKPSFPEQSARGTPHQLNSNSAFVDVNGVNYFPDDFDDMASNRRNESARARRRNRGSDSSPRAISQGAPAPDPFGSTTSLNVDRLSKKNEDRLRRLRELQGDDISLYDPDDVLDRFMSKQSQNRLPSNGGFSKAISLDRPPSGQTLQDDSWMQTGAISKAGY